MDDFKSLKRELKRLVESNPDVEAGAIVTSQGFIIVSFFPEAIDDTKIAAIIAAIFLLGERGVLEATRGNLKRIMIEGDNGLILLMAVGKNRILVLSTTRYPRLGAGLGSSFSTFLFPGPDSDDEDATGLRLSEIF